jgi:Domain of unknown function (DUF4160)
MPTVLQIDGFEVMIYPNDHGPPHVHVFRAEGEVIINIGDSTVRDAWEMKAKDIRRAQELVEQNREFLMEEWDRLHP